MRFYRPELDVLRFCAFSLVFLHHTCSSIHDQMVEQGGITAAIAIIARTGAWGVDLFFLLSAYLITTLLLQERVATLSVDVKAFYMRRILRIWPLYISFVLCCYALQYVTPTNFPFAGLIAFLFLAGNWYLALGNFTSPVTILWSVSIEEQFYLLWPLVMRRTSRKTMVAFGVALLIIASGARLGLLLRGAEEMAIWCNTFARLDPIAIGIITALVLEDTIPRFSRVTRLLLLSSGLGVLFVGNAVFHATGGFPLSVIDGMLGFPCGAIGVLLIFLAFIGVQLEVPRLIYLGRISYGLYVFHLFALDLAKVALLRELGTCPWWMRFAIGLPITIGLASISYNYLEKPFLNLKTQFERGKMPMVLVPLVSESDNRP